MFKCLTYNSVGFAYNLYILSNLTVSELHSNINSTELLCILCYLKNNDPKNDKNVCTCSNTDFFFNPQMFPYELG